MNLREVLLKSEELEESEVIFARKPWSLESEATVIAFDSEAVVPRFISSLSLEYFLEVPLVKEIRDQIIEGGGRLEDVPQVLLYYAENDAFPPI